MQIVDDCLGNFRPALPKNLAPSDDEPKPEAVATAKPKNKSLAMIGQRKKD
jgi:hypothetical protein